MTFETIKRNYTTGMWNKQLVKMAVRNGFISPAQYKEITGEDYID